MKDGSLPKPIPEKLPESDQEKREKLKALSDALGLSNMQTDIDSLKDNVGYIRKGFEELVLSWQQFNQNQNIPQQQAVPTATTPPNTAIDPISRAHAISEVIAPLSELVKAWKGTPNATVPQSSQLVDIIMNSFTKLMQIQVDNAILNTYPNAQNYIKPPTFVKNLSHEPI